MRKTVENERTENRYRHPVQNHGDNIFLGRVRKAMRRSSHPELMKPLTKTVISSHSNEVDWYFPTP